MNKNTIVPAAFAIKNAQSFNRKQWLDHAMETVSDIIVLKSKQGFRTVSISFEILIKGAENLHEAGELLQLLQKEFVSAGYIVKVDIKGNIIISW